MLYLAVTTAVVISVRTIGNILVVALLVTPAAIARMYTDKLSIMMALAAGAGVTGSVLGVWLSWAYDTPTGATVVLCLTAIFVLSWLFSPQQGLVAERIRNRDPKERMTVDAVSSS